MVIQEALNARLRELGFMRLFRAHEDLDEPTDGTTGIFALELEKRILKLGANVRPAAVRPVDLLEGLGPAFAPSDIRHRLTSHNSLTGCRL